MATNTIYQTALFKYLESVDAKLSGDCLKFISHISPILDSIVKYFPFYTRHDAGHSLQVVFKMEKILNQESFQIGNPLAFSPSEAFLLICGAYGHDLGMAVLPGEEDDILTGIQLEKKPGWETHAVLQEYLRRTHSERGGQFIIAHINSIGVPTHLHQQLDLLMKAHNFSVSSLQAQLGRRFSADSLEIDLLQLACILCSADLLEFSDTRVIDGVIEQLQEAIQEESNPALLTSLRENLKHVCIGSNLGVGSDGQIIMTGTFTDPEVLNITYKTVDYIEKWIRDYGDIDHRTNRRRLKIRTDSIYTTFDIPGREFERLGIRMNKQNVIGLIASNAIWNNQPATVIRELIQNSVEACRYRLSYSNDPKYIPAIQLIFDSRNWAVKIIDNGCGMSRSTILNNFLTVGNSRAKEAGYAGENYASLARFGIGFWSVFTIADFATVQTAEHLPGIRPNEEGLTFDVSIDLFKDYILFERKKLNPGTQIVIKLKKDVNMNELANRIAGRFGVVHCSAIPIHISFGNISLNLPAKPVPPTLGELMGPKIAFAEAEGISLYLQHSEMGSIGLDSFILFRKSGSLVSFRYSNGVVISLIPHGYEFVCVCGFVVALQLSFPIHEVIGDVFGYIANTINPRGFEYNINRQVLQNTAESELYSQTIARELVATYRSFLKAQNCYNVKDIVRLYEEGTYSNRGGTFDTSNKLQQLMGEASDILCYRLCHLESSKNYNSCEMEYLNISELRERKYRIVTAAQIFSVHNSTQAFRINEHGFYELCKPFQSDENITAFVHRGEFDLMFTNDPASYIIFKKIELQGIAPFYVCFFFSNTDTVDPEADKSWILGTVRGTAWAGFIAEKKIVGADFAFANQKFFFQPDTELARDMRNLYAEGQHTEICSLINSLELSLYGHIDVSIQKYLSTS